MSYLPYADEAYYENEYKGTAVEHSSLFNALKRASRDIDSLTFNRIVSEGFDNLTEYQKEIVKEVVCMQADFLHENAEMLENTLSGYSVNGVSMQFGGQNVHVSNGVFALKSTVRLLDQTGLTCRLLR